MHLKARFAAAVMGLIFLGTGHAPAMDFLFFARMALDDQSDYVASLVVGSAKMLRTTGHADEAQKAIALFKDPSDRGGVHQLALNMRAMQAKNTLMQSAGNGRQASYDVEAAMQLTLRNNGVDVPLKYLETVNRKFTPSLPMRTHV